MYYLYDMTLLSTSDTAASRVTPPCVIDTSTSNKEFIKRCMHVQ